VGRGDATASHCTYYSCKIPFGNDVVNARDGEADTTISASDQTFLRIVNGEQNATTAFMTGKLRVKGDMGNAMQLQKLF
jgi:putative sterol carrier protein